MRPVPPHNRDQHDLGRGFQATVGGHAAHSLPSFEQVTTSLSLDFLSYKRER